MFKKLAAIALVALTACTPEDIAEKVQEAMNPTPPPGIVCEEPAAPEAHHIMLVEPVRQTFASVACKRGWEPQRILEWWPFVEDVAMKESMGCFNLRRAPVFVRGTGWGDSCVDNLVRNKRTEDSGYGQVTRSGWGPRGVVCRTTGLCSAEQIIESPWNSMTALVVFIEHNGSQPWCYNAKARRFHNCSLAPDR